MCDRSRSSFDHRVAPRPAIWDAVAPLNQRWILVALDAAPAAYPATEEGVVPKMTWVRLGGVVLAGAVSIASLPVFAVADRSVPLSPADPVAVYRGLGAWVDMYDSGPWRYPRRAVDKMSERGVDTLYLETANYRKPHDAPMYRPKAVAAMIERAHALKMRVVAWYVPSFSNLRRDFRRSMTAVRFQTPAGDRFDSFALDIEATVVRDIATRNERAKALSRRLREAVGDTYALGAIVPEAGALYWPDFPYRALDRRYDAFLPMAYFSYRTSGYRGVYDFVAANVRAIRRQTGNLDVPIHVIGGIAEDSSATEVEALVDAAADKRAKGTSLYDFPTTSQTQWRKLQAVREP